VQEVLSSGEARRQFLEACTPSVFNQEGKRERSLELNDLYARGPMVYIKTLEDWRSRGEFRGLELKN